MMPYYPSVPLDPATTISPISPSKVFHLSYTRDYTRIDHGVMQLIDRFDCIMPDMSFSDPQLLATGDFMMPVH